MISAAKVLFSISEEMQAVEPLQVVEAVAVLQLLHLLLEDEVEGRAQHAAERHGLLGEAADPEIDVVEAAERAAGVGAGGVEEVEAVGWARRVAAERLVPKISVMAASRLPSIVVWPVISACVP